MASPTWCFNQIAKPNKIRILDELCGEGEIISKTHDKSTYYGYKQQGLHEPSLILTLGDVKAPKQSIDEITRELPERKLLKQLNTRMSIQDLPSETPILQK